MIAQRTRVSADREGRSLGLEREKEQPKAAPGAICAPTHPDNSGELVRLQ
ncbi:MAG TPA: hypothetical protein VN426_05405 [Syntrophomonadaceae bacterium]|nr:hypothetical protein [Syntrophomonadaceae bacterium]